MLAAVSRSVTAAANLKFLILVDLIAVPTGGFGNSHWTLDTDVPIMKIFENVVKRLT